MRIFAPLGVDKWKRTRHRKKPFNDCDSKPVIGEPLERRVLMSALPAALDPAPEAAPLAQLELFPSNASASLRGAADTQVSIPDPYLRAALLRALGKPQTITTSDMLSLTSLTAMHFHDHAHSITNLSGLQYARNLTYLNLNFNDISDLSPLSGLTNLASLHLYENQVSDVTALEDLIKLRKLDLGLDNIADIIALREMSKMEALNLHGNDLTDISVLSEMRDLRELNLRADRVADVGVLSGLKKLQLLDLRYNELSDTSPELMAVVSTLRARGTAVEYLPQ